MPRKFKILIIEDEVAIRTGLTDLFVFHGYQVELAEDGKSGLVKALSIKPDLILLDVMLPNMNGFDVCNEIRNHDRSVPIIMLTAKTSEEDILTGLRLGADDYISKPFSIEELVLRVKAVLRRNEGDSKQQAEFIIASTLKIDSQNLTGILLSTGKNLEFSRREVEILRYLLAHRDRPISRDELLEQVWGYAKASSIETRTVDIHIAKLRRKIEIDSKHPKLLLTIRGEGYRLVE